MRRFGIVFGVLLLLTGWLVSVGASAQDEQSLLLALQMKPADGSGVDQETLETTARIIERRIEGLSITNSTVSTSGNDLIYVILPGVGDADAEQTTDAIVSSKTIEIVNTNGEFIDPGPYIQTKLGAPVETASPGEAVTKDYVLGTVAMANAGPDTNGSRFFIVLADLHGQLPKDYTIFGQVTSGSM